MHEFCPRGLFASSRPVSQPLAGIVRNNGAIIKMKRVPTRWTATGGIRVIWLYILRGTKTLVRRVMRNFLFTSGTDVDMCIFSTCSFFFLLFNILEIRIFFRKGALYFPHTTSGALIYEELQM